MAERHPQNILVTGGCGFIGSAFIRRMLRTSAAERIVNLDLLTYAANPENLSPFASSPRYTFQQGDIRDGDLVARLCAEHRIDTIVHFAAETHVDRSITGPSDFVQTNVVGTQALLDVVRKQMHIHFHHVSTDEVYGSLGPTGRFSEQSPYNPSSPYSASKAASDHLVRAYARTYGISTTISNCSNNYGPHQLPDKLVPLMIKNLYQRQELPVYGTGLNVRDWLYVDDHVEAIWDILRWGRNAETYNIGGGAELSNLSLIEKLIRAVEELTGRRSDLSRTLITFVPDRPGHDARYAVDCSKIKEELGWLPRTGIEDGLLKTVSWMLRAPWAEQ